MRVSREKSLKYIQGTDSWPPALLQPELCFLSWLSPGLCELLPFCCDSTVAAAQLVLLEARVNWLVSDLELLTLIPVKYMW